MKGSNVGALIGSLGVDSTRNTIRNPQHNIGNY